ncbi:hypothetical protein C9374_009905 [Naegleria lovaniensis]|uniref:pantothenate kinase n=1 Tax=Naegleria lovaniensis TaxID=51637 RepID=A0AA88GGR8_NAELO|nr:uncharacterized protein C9374_009905 [Naegleria lovaniensis]KAG2375282.1 hypothetical protein C9374_009905 [Naegleria lovaniensis]
MDSKLSSSSTTSTTQNKSDNIPMTATSSSSPSTNASESQQPIKIAKKDDFRDDDDHSVSMSPKVVATGALSVKIPSNSNLVGAAVVAGGNQSPVRVSYQQQQQSNSSSMYKKTIPSPPSSSLNTNNTSPSALTTALNSSMYQEGREDGNNINSSDSSQFSDPTSLNNNNKSEENGTNDSDNTGGNIAEDHFIFLPNHNEPFHHFALDIGGSLVKMVYMVPFDSENEIIYQTKDLESNELEAYYHHASSDDEEDGKLSIKSLPPQSPLIINDVKDHFACNNETKRGSKLCFARFQTADIEDCLSLIEKLLKLDDSMPQHQIKHINATGGGAFKFASLLKNRFGLEVNKLDEMESLIKGLNFLLMNLPNESFKFTREKKREYISFQEGSNNDVFPYLLVNIGSGVSILRVDGLGMFERVSGSSIGGGTFWGLCKLLTGCSSFEEILKLTKQGDNKPVDMLVGDIYGRDYEKIGLPSDIIASSFGKLIMQKTGSEETVKPKAADLAKSLLFMICNNIGQIAYLNALRFGLKRIFFAGYFIRGHDITMHYISYAIQFWSKGTISAMFLRHEGYLGAIGSFLSSKSKDVDNDNNTPTTE